MKSAICTLMVGMLWACQPTGQRAFVEEPAVLEVPDVDFEMNQVLYNRMNSRWISKSDSSDVSGFVKSYYSDGSLQKIFGVLKGKKEGVQKTFDPDGSMQFLETYKNNKLHGEVKRWTLDEGYRLSAHLNYVNGKLQGEQRKWYATGEIHKILNLVDGKEKGLQQAFRKNGALYANYEAKNGRIFGMKKSNLCYELESEEIVFYQD